MVQKLPAGQGHSVFNDLVKPVNPPNEYELISQPYNRVESHEGHSELRIRVTDGKGLLGKKVTLLQIRRRDYSKERARLHHALPIPLPYREYRSFTIVTDTEVKIVESLKQQAPDVVARYFVPSNRISERSYLEDLLAGMTKIANQF